MTKTKLQIRREAAGLTIEELAEKINREKFYFGMFDVFPNGLATDEVVKRLRKAEKPLKGGGNLSTTNSIHLAAAKSLNCTVDDLIE